MGSVAKRAACAAPVCAGVWTIVLTATLASAGQLVTVTVDNFDRAESDLYFARMVKDGGLGKLHHKRQVTPVERQNGVRMNRDTIYSSGVFDLDAAPVTITLPDPGKRFISLQSISEDHYAAEADNNPGSHTFTREEVGTRYVVLVVRIQADAQDPKDVAAANTLQDEIDVEQPQVGKFEVPDWDEQSQARVRDALSVLGSTLGNSPRTLFGTRSEVDPLLHLIGTAVGWGGIPKTAAFYVGRFPSANDGKTVHQLIVKDVPVDGFWSISVYNAKGYFEKNDLGAYSLNNLTARPNLDGSFTVRFGGCHKDIPNCLPITTGWNYTVRLYRPRQEILDGSWTFPEAEPLK
jgi:para-nitrobenzyl esterase